MNDSNKSVKEKVEPISLLQHSVRVPNPYLLQFFYPQLSTIVSSIEEYEAGMTNIIYDGNYKLIAKFKQSNIDYIATNVPVFEYDLTDKSELIKFVYSKYRKNPPSYLTNSALLNSMSYDECLTYCKMFWVSGVWFGVKEEDTKKSFDFLLSVCNDPYLVVLKNYYELNFDVIPTLLGFLFNVSSGGDSKDGSYKNLLVKASISFGNKIRPAVYNYLKSPIKDTKLRGFYLVEDIVRPS